VVESNTDEHHRLYFVAHGTIIEKDGKKEEFVPQMKHNMGKVAGLQSLVSDAEHDYQIANIYCHDSGMARITPINTIYLREVLS